MIGLLPCPFCGASGGAVVLDEATEAYIVCKVCTAVGPDERPGSSAQEMWNRRPGAAERELADAFAGDLRRQLTDALQLAQAALELAKAMRPPILFGAAVQQGTAAHQAIEAATPLCYGGPGDIFDSFIVGQPAHRDIAKGEAIQVRMTDAQTTQWAPDPGIGSWAPHEQAACDASPPHMCEIAPGTFMISGMSLFDTVVDGTPFAATLFKDFKDQS